MNLRSNLVDNGAVSAVITTADFKTHARIYHSQDDTYIDTLIVSSTQAIEHATRRAFVNRSFIYTLVDFPSPGFPSSIESTGSANGEIILPRSPMSSITSIVYNNTSSVATTLIENTGYYSYSINGVGRIVAPSSTAWPQVEDLGRPAVTITFIAGYGSSASSTPAALRHAVMLMATHLYENRQPVNIGNTVNDIPKTVDALIAQYHTGDYA